VGQSVTLTATATDAEDGTLAASRMQWYVVLRHGTHNHPFAGPSAGSSLTLTYPSPENLVAATNSYLLLRASATDSSGLRTDVYRALYPRKVSLSFSTSPSGGYVVVGGTNRTTPATVTSWANYRLTINAPNQTIGGQSYRFSSWSDGGAQSHVITTPTSARSYQARFVR
jgi:hypothetical protein